MGNPSKPFVSGIAASTLILLASAPAFAAAPGELVSEVCTSCTNGVTGLLVGGQGSYAVLTEEQMSTAFGGYFAPYDQRISVPFPGDAEFDESIPVGSTNLYNAVYAQPAGTVMTIGGVSKGAPSVIYALKHLEVDRENTTDGLTPPDPDHMNVMIYGSPSRVYYSLVSYRPTLPVTPYDVVMVSAEYDGVADFPDNPFNLLAVLNAYEGGDMPHVDAAFNTDFATDPVHYKVVTNADGGTVTYIVIPYDDPILPLLYPRLDAGGDPVALAKLSAFLKPIIDSAYKRNRVFQRSKWSDGIVNIPLPAAATPAPAEVNPPASGLMSSATTTLAATSSAATSTTEYSGQHRLTENVVTKKVKDDEGPKPFKKWFKKKDAETTSDTKKNDDEPKQAETQDTEPSNTTSTTSNDTSTNGGDAGES